MFLNELQPALKELVQQPIAFLGGFASGVLRIKLTDDPLKSWLEKQGATPFPTDASSGNGSGPQSISIE